MKRITIVIALLLVALQPALADRVSPETAQQVARQFFNNNEKKCVMLDDCTQAAGFENLYIFNTKNGFVVISADDRALPILGYSMTGTFNAYQLPEHIKGWLQGYDNEIQSAIENDLQATAEVRRQWQELKTGAKGTKATVVVAPLLTTLWDQGEPYNNLCPTVSGTATYSGCVATSMAQVMKYWNWPIQGNSSTSYKWYYQNWSYQTLTVNFGNTTYDWANMTDTYDSNSTEAENTAVATLMYHCGVSVSMDYGTDGSGAYSTDIPNALKNYFRYASATYKQKTSTNWNSTIKAELDAGRPVQYSGSGSGGGHAFVCDGYDNSNYFHFNWGWSGSCDGYYSFSSLAPGTGGAGAGTTGDFTNSQAAVINIIPTYSITNAPSNVSATLTQDIATRNVTVSWSTLSGASSYQVFRNTQLIGTTTSTSFTDVNAPYGSNSYYVRGLNSSNGISPYSNKATVNINFLAPTNLTASLKDDLFTVSWEPSALAVSYNLYCNDMLVASDLTETEISFTLRVYGDLTFYVRAIDFSGLRSDASNTATLNQPFRGPLVDDLTATLNGNSAQITWTALEGSTSYLNTYGDYNSGIYGISAGNNKTYWAVRFTPAILSFYAGTALVDVETYIYEAGTYQVSVYQGTGDTPSGTALATASGTYTTSSTGWQTITFTNPVVIDHTKDLWIVYSSSDVSVLLLAPLENDNYDLYSTDGKTWSHQTGCTWLIWAGFSDGDYTYNLYRNGTCIAQKMTNTSYTDASLGNNGAYRYTVRTNYYGGESDDSNFCEYVLGEASHNESITMTRNDYLFVTENSHLTVKGDVSNSYPSHLVIRPNAQLTATSAFAGTMQKNIGAYSTGTTVNDGWHLLASPVFEDTPVADITNLIPDNADDYDLYWFDQVGDSEGKEWMNYKVENQQPDWKVGEGRLYANKQGTTLSFAGTLNKQPGNGIPVAYEAGYDFSGFNLIGNPYTCDAYLTDNYYRMNEAGTEIVLGSGAVKPCEGVFVQVNETGFATFTTTSAKQNGISLDVSKASGLLGEKGKATERALIRFDGGDALTKYMLNDKNTKLYIPQGNNDYAVVQHQGERELPVNFHAAENGYYTLDVHVEDIEMDYLHLIDNLNGADIDLLQTPSYSFEAKTNDYASRFRLVLSPAGTNNGHFAFFNGSEWVVSNEGEATLQVIDMMGRVLSSQTINGNANVNINDAKGVYVIRLIQNDLVKTQKILKE